MSILNKTLLSCVFGTAPVVQRYCSYKYHSDKYNTQPLRRRILSNWPVTVSNKMIALSQVSNEPQPRQGAFAGEAKRCLPDQKVGC